MRTAGLLAAACAVALAACGGRPATRTGEFDVFERKATVAHREVTATCVRPKTPCHPDRLIVFCTGDAGWLGTSGKVFERLAELGYSVAGYDAREMLAPIRKSGGQLGLSDTASWLDDLFREARADAGVPPATPLILVGYSRGAGVAVLASALPILRPQISGAVAIALTRESDYLRAPDPADHSLELQVDGKGRILLYPAIALAGATPLAVIQSAGDGYVPAAEARSLFGPDTPTRRLYDVEARNHRFSGGQDTMLRDLEDALGWMDGPARAAAPDSAP